MASELGLGPTLEEVDADEATLVLEGVELDHGSLRAVIATLDHLMGASPQPPPA